MNVNFGKKTATIKMAEGGELAESDCAGAFEGTRYTVEKFVKK